MPSITHESVGTRRCRRNTNAMPSITHESTDIATALAMLRERTAPLHVRLDRCSDLTMLLSSGCSLADYKKAIMSLAAVYHGVDSVLMKGQRHCPAALPAYVPHLPYLRADMQRLGISVPASPVLELSAPSGKASYLGMRYVIEGSNLGARVIYRALQKTEIAQAIEVDKCYWSLAQTWQTSWPPLLRQLADLRTQDAWHEAADSACSMFEHFIHFLTSERK